MNIQLSIFDFVSGDDLLTRTLLRGSGVEGGKGRIAEVASVSSIEELAKFLKHEYGIGGWSGPGLPKVDFDSKGLQVGMDWDHRDLYTWEQVAKRIMELIITGRYIGEERNA